MYVSVAVRMLDTRTTIGGHPGKLTDFDLAIRGVDEIPDDATSVVLNVTATEGPAGHLVGVLLVNGLPDRLDLAGPDVRLAVKASIPIVVSTDAALRARAREHAARRRHGATGLGLGGARAQHVPTRRGAFVGSVERPGRMPASRWGLNVVGGSVTTTPEVGRWDALVATRTRGEVGDGIASVLAFLGVPDLISFTSRFPDPETFPRERVSTLFQELAASGEATAFQSPRRAGSPGCWDALAGRLETLQGAARQTTSC